MSEEIFDDRTESIEVDRKLRRVKRNGPRMWVRGSRGQEEVLAAAGEAEKARLFDYCRKIASRLLPADSRIAFIGGGFCLMPQVVSLRQWGAIDIYEIELHIRVEAGIENPALSRNWLFIDGDYKETITGLYDVIVYDLQELPDIEILKKHFTTNGLALGWAPV